MVSVSSARVLLSDDHAIVRHGLLTILEDTEQFEVRGEAAEGSQTIQLATQLAPDILILDISMPPPNGLEVAAQLHQTLPDTKILMITMNESDEMLRAAGAAGASGYLLKSDAEQLLTVALNLLEEGRSSARPVFSPELAKQLFD